MQFYFGILNKQQINDLCVTTPSSANPRIYTGQTVEEDANNLIRSGFIQVGYSNFNASAANVSDAVEQAKAVSAEVVVVYTKHTNTLQGNYDYYLPDTKTSTTLSNGNVYGDVNLSYSGTDTTTTYESKKYTVPYTVNRYDYLATYWAKGKRLRLGVRLNPLSPEIRQEIGSNKGVVIANVMDNSPAFMADILEGDILKKINSDEILDVKSGLDIIAKHAGERIVMTLIRNSKIITKNVQLND